jgi:hypothetical protein
MSKNGHVVTPKAVEIEGPNRRRQNRFASEKVRLDGNCQHRDKNGPVTGLKWGQLA